MTNSKKIVVYKIRMDCEECGSAVFLNGPLKEVQCRACLSILKIKAENWKSLLSIDDEDYDQLSSGKYHMTGSLMSGERKYIYNVAAQQPCCPNCKEELVLDEIDAKADREIVCTSCGHRASTYRAPDWLRKELPEARQVFCAQQEGEGDAAEPTPETLRPVMMSCLHCGGTLEITSETERIVACEYCDTDHFLPDDLWRRMHPLKKRKPWYLFFGDAEWGQTAPTPAKKERSNSNAREPKYIECARCGARVTQRKAFFTEDGEVCASCFK